MNQEKLTPDDGAWKAVVFKECGTHKGLLFACERCPVCKTVEDADLKLGQLEEENIQLSGRVEDLEERLQGYRAELGL